MPEIETATALFTPLSSFFPFPNEGARFVTDTMRHNFAVLSGWNLEDPETQRLHQEFQAAVLGGPIVEIPHAGSKARRVLVHADEAGRIAEIVPPAEIETAGIPDGFRRLGFYVQIDSANCWAPHHTIEGITDYPHHIERGLQESFSALHCSMQLGQRTEVLASEAERLGGVHNLDPAGWTARFGVFSGILLPPAE